MVLIPMNIFGQTFLRTPVNYNSRETSEEIKNGEIKKFLTEKTEWKVEKRRGRWSISWLSPDEVESKVNKIFSKGIPEYTSRTNGGYWFYISVEDSIDEDIVLKTLKFEVDSYTQKIKTIEVYLQEK